MRELTVSDYFIEFLIANGIEDVFGYQGGMIAYIFDSIGKYNNKIRYHYCANEQAASFEACSWAQSTGKCGICISTSGPGFTNMITGIANAWFDSIPVIFISGNVNTKDKKRNRPLKQDGFQEIQAIEISKPIVKKTYEVELQMDYVELFNDALKTAISGRKGPVYIDLPINICRETIQLIDDIQPLSSFDFHAFQNQPLITDISTKLSLCKRPLIIAGAGIKQSKCISIFKELLSLIDSPVVTTLPAFDILTTDNDYNCGFIGATGRREAGVILKNADFIISLGSRLCSKQLGHNLKEFAPNATLVRVDIDESEFVRKIKEDEIDVLSDLSSFISALILSLKSNNIFLSHSKWINQCREIKRLLRDFDLTNVNVFINKLTYLLPEASNIVFDVGKNMQYCGQSTIIKNNTKVLMSAGLGAMGYSLPASIGAYIGNQNPTYSINGDGGLLMNIQELNAISKLNLPIKIIILNNKSLGNIRLFQENYLGERYTATTEGLGGYYSTDFVRVAEGFGISAARIGLNDNINIYYDKLTNNTPFLLELEYEDESALPGIVACGDFINGGQNLPKDVKDRLIEIIEDI